MIKKNFSKKEIKRSTKEKFKKLILSWWFWVIVALISYVIFVLIPIQWTGNGLEIVEGTGTLKTFFAYLTQIAWIIVVCLLIFEFIKWIQKTKIGDYWKTAITILGIIGIIAYVIYSVSGWAVFENLTYEHDDRIGDLDNEKIIKTHIKLLEEDGYEVLYFYYALEGTDLEGGSLKMKSLGNRNNQVWAGLFALGQVYPDALEYTIIILEPTQECWYTITGLSYNAYRGLTEATLDGEVVDTQTLYNIVLQQIENPYCE